MRQLGAVVAGGGACALAYAVLMGRTEGAEEQKQLMCLIGGGIALLVGGVLVWVDKIRSRKRDKVLSQKRDRVVHPRKR
jgi:hypothetical protein